MWGGYSAVPAVAQPSSCFVELSTESKAPPPLGRAFLNFERGLLSREQWPQLSLIT
jgi:hypothetical protein